MDSSPILKIAEALLSNGFFGRSFKGATPDMNTEQILRLASKNLEKDPTIGAVGLVAPTSQSGASVVQLASDLLKSGISFKDIAARFGTDVAAKAIQMNAQKLGSVYSGMTNAIRSGNYLMK